MSLNNITVDSIYGQIFQDLDSINFERIFQFRLSNQLALGS